jgi:hypothetical protein
MKTLKIGDKQVQCYQDDDLETAEFQQVCGTAKELWTNRCDEYVKKNGDKGSAVIGAGFTVRHLPPGARKPRPKMVLHSPMVAQGSLVWETSKDEVEKVFRDAGIEVDYAWGSMD